MFVWKSKVTGWIITFQSDHLAILFFLLSFFSTYLLSYLSFFSFLEAPVLPSFLKGNNILSSSSFIFLLHPTSFLSSFSPSFCRDLYIPLIQAWIPKPVTDLWKNRTSLVIWKITSGNSGHDFTSPSNLELIGGCPFFSLWNSGKETKECSKRYSGLWQSPQAHYLSVPCSHS